MHANGGGQPSCLLGVPLPTLRQTTSTHASETIDKFMTPGLFTSHHNRHSQLDSSLSEISCYVAYRAVRFDSNRLRRGVCVSSGYAS